MMPTAISQILEQIVNAVVSIIGASYLLEMGKKWRKKRAMTLWHMHMEQQEELLGTVC